MILVEYLLNESWKGVLGPVSLRLMTSQFKDIVTHRQKMKIVKCTFCGVWVQNFVWNFKGALWNFTQNFEPIHRKICILRGVRNLTTYDILELWNLKSSWDGPLGFYFPVLWVSCWELCLLIASVVDLTVIKTNTRCNNREITINYFSNAKLVIYYISVLSERAMWFSFLTILTLLSETNCEIVFFKIFTHGIFTNFNMLVSVFLPRGFSIFLKFVFRHVSPILGFF